MAYQRWPAAAARLLTKKHHLKYLYRRPGGSPRSVCRSIFPEVNNESTDASTELAHSRLAGCSSRAECTWKAYVICRTFDRKALELKAWRQPWVSALDGVGRLLAEVGKPHRLFTSSFGPNCRTRNEVRNAKSPKRYVLNLFADSDNVKPLTWRFRRNKRNVYLSKPEIFEQLLRLPYVGNLTAKNMFQLLKVHDEHSDNSPVTSVNQKKWRSRRFAFTSTGARYCLNLLLHEPGGSEISGGGGKGEDLGEKRPTGKGGERP